ncbi:MAG: CusA/CzcA family heavy metal efflux RND transporter [Candidatus Obscuribacterales bacterium]|nr:CusA/CzcA family heavy metal efflux RND transporter [Candidatus Obscuribacterales bacterium]
MENFIASLVKQRLLVCFCFVLCIVGGVNAFLNLPIDAFPDLANNQVQVLTESPGMVPLEVEQLVTIPIESIMNGLPGVVQVRSVSKFGLSIVSVVFQDRIDTYFARQLVLERLQSAKARLPKGVDPQLGPITTAMGEIYQYVVSGRGYTAAELKTLQDWDIRYQLRTVPGVTEVNTWGGFTQEYVITIIPARLQQYGLTLKDVFTAIENNNENFGAGIIDHESEQYTVRGVGRLHTLEDIANITVKTQNAVPVYIRNIAQVSYGHALRQGAATKDGKGEVVTAIVMMLKGENSREVIGRIQDRIKEIQKSLPEAVTLKPFYDQADLVEQTIHTVQTNLIEGGILVIAVLLLMLGNVTAAIIVALTIPLSLLFSFMGMRELGITANVMSLGAIDFGMIVDGSIVMVENSLTKLSHAREGEDRLAVIQESVREMARPIFFGILIITVVYMPILSLQGMEYKMFSPMVFTVCFALLGSLLIALTLVPTLCSLLLRGKISEKENWLIRLIKPVYLRTLDLALKFKAITICLSCVAFAITLSLIPLLGTEFVPQLDEGDMIIETRNIPSISLPEALKVSSRIEKSLMPFPEVKTVVSKTGRPDLATDPMGVYQTDVYVILKPKSEWLAGVTRAKLVDQMRIKLNQDVPEANYNFTQPIAMRVNELVSGVRADVAVKIFGDDIEVLQQKADEIKNIIAGIPGQKDLQVEQLTGSGQLLITPDRARMARYGVDIDDIRTVVQTAIIGTPVSEVLEGRKRFDIRVKFPEITKDTIQSIDNLLIETATGQRIPVSQVAKTELVQGLDAINREFSQRRIIVQCNVHGRDIGSFVQEGQEKISKAVKLPPGYYIRWGGQFENQQRAMQRLSFVVPLSILIIFFLLVTTFGSVKDALIVMTNVPFALIGGVVALWVRGMYLSVPASIGFIALFGVAVLNGLVLISTVNRLISEGESVEQAIRHAAGTRLRPVLMTALVATLGFLPMAVSTGSGAEVQKPLATVVIGGLVTSTLLTLLVLPAIYAWLTKAPKVKK